MPPTTQSLGIDTLSAEDRLSLTTEIGDSLAAESNLPSLLTEAQRRELGRRVADAKVRPEALTPWEQVKADALAPFDAGEGVELARATSELSDELKRELDRFIAEDDANPEGAIPWEEVRASVPTGLQR